MRGATGVYPVKCHTCDFNPRTPRGVRRGAYTHTVWFSPYFNPRAPCGARLVALHKGGGKPGISIHALREGCDLRSALGLFGSEGISIHAPHAGRDADDDGGKRRVLISIHAPHAGRDSDTSRSARSSCKFQSPRPMRGATQLASNTLPAIGISIHAPHAGRDYRGPDPQIYGRISIHAPHAGRDGVALAVGGGIHPISIHAPHAGRDEAIQNKVTLRGNFNPRAPCGARPTLS